MDKGQANFAMIFVLLVFGLILFVGLLGPMGGLAYGAVVSGGLSGIEGWFFSNIILWFILGFILACIAVFRLVF